MNVEDNTGQVSSTMIQYILKYLYLSVQDGDTSPQRRQSQDHGFSVGQGMLQFGIPVSVGIF